MKTFLLYFFFPLILVVSNTTFFDTGNPVLLRPSYAELKRVAAILKANLSLQVEIGGHTKLTAKGYGHTKPVSDNHTETGKQRNRRVEFRIIRK